ncbi:HNH endonuclease [Brachyspira sp.]|uniref:HNH endonuclease n=1 Tax=Brachyspira sp. TaxID=1977261 RepID=UPI003D7CDC4B
MKKCYICGEKLTKDNTSSEHIIPNAIGGKLKSKELICKKCNSKLGDSMDNELAKQLEFFSNFLNIDRERGKPNDIIFTEKETNTEYRRKANGEFLPKNDLEIKKEIMDDGKIRFYISSTNKKTVLKKGEEISKKYEITNEDIENRLKYTKHNLNEMRISLTFGGEDIKLALYKIVINFFIYSGGDIKYIEHLINCLRQNNTDNTNGYSKQISTKNTDSIKENSIPHIIYVEGNSEEHTLYAYIEFFGTIQFLILLNNNYDGVDMKYTYCYDFISKSKIDISSFNLKLDYNKIKNNKYDIDLKISNDLFNRFKYLLDIKEIRELTSKLENDNLSSEEKYNLYVKIADGYSYLKLYKEAIEYYTYAININNLYGYTYYIRGSIYFLLEDDENCTNDYIKYLNLEMDINYNELIIIAHRFINLNKYKYAINCYVRAISIEEPTKEVYKEIAGLYTELGDFTNAYKYYECSLKLDNDYYDAHICRLLLFFKKYCNINNNADIKNWYNNIEFANELIKKLKNNRVNSTKHLNLAILDINKMLDIDYHNDLVQLKNILIELIEIVEKE